MLFMWTSYLTHVQCNYPMFTVIGCCYGSLHLSTVLLNCRVQTASLDCRAQSSTTFFSFQENRESCYSGHLTFGRPGPVSPSSLTVNNLNLSSSKQERGLFLN